MNPSPEDHNSPEPSETAGLESGGGVQPGDTPPTAGQMSGTSPDADKVPNHGPVSGNRTPMIITLSVLALVVISIAVLTGASFIAS